MKKQPLAGMGRSSVLNFITREAADAEKQTLDREITKLKAELDDAMKNLKLKDEEIEERKQIGNSVSFFAFLHVIDILYCVQREI